MDRRWEQHGQLVDQRGLPTRIRARAACLEGYEPDAAILARAQREANVTLTRDPNEAAEGADVVNTDVWASMGQEGEQKQRERAFAGIR